MLLKNIAKQSIFISRIPQLCAILQLVSAPLSLICLTLQKPEIRPGSIGHLARKAFSLVLTILTFSKNLFTTGCQEIKLNKNFTVCHETVDPEPYIKACQYETCLCKYGGDCACFCTAVAAYVRACNRFGISITWRREGFCGKIKVQIYKYLQNITSVLISGENS